MADGRKKSTKDTGTVPKVKYWKNSSHPETHVANNLSNLMLTNVEGAHLQPVVRNGQRCMKYECLEDIHSDDSRIFQNHNSLPFMNMSGRNSPNTSGSGSRRHSAGTIRKCDNITKYPDKKQIEEKLNQIREYLKVTSSLMTNVKEDQSSSDETDDLYQMLSALQDSERKLEALLVNRETNMQEDDCNASKEPKPEVVEMNGHILDSDMPVFTFQNNVAPQNELEYKMEISEKKLQALHEQQNVLLRLQEKAENQLKDARKAQERLAMCVASPVPIAPHATPEKNKSVDTGLLHQTDSDSHSDAEILNQPNEEDRGQLLQLLDARDNQLCVEQSALQQKLYDLNSKKHQIDQLVSQLHNCGEEDTDDMTNQIKQIVAMKQQLSTLKDMLSAVKSTEVALQGNNSGVEQEELDRKSENVPENEVEQRWNSAPKHSNKSSVCSSREQLQLHAELQAKKQELEELMYKDQDYTSAMNQDHSLDALTAPWGFLQEPTPPRDTRENMYSSDEDELDTYPVMNNKEKHSPGPLVNGNVIIPPPGTSSSSPFSNYTGQPTGSVEPKQLELMMNLCQSLLEQQQIGSPQPGGQWFNTYMHMQHALMLSTISQCCQLLWLQHQDISNLVNTVTMMQQDQQQHKYAPPPPPSRPVKISQAPSPPDTEYAGLSRNVTPGQPARWGGPPTLNNQVAPGNRANNYWDNFRSYSRQNLLSTATKSNEGSHNSLPVIERPERSNRAENKRNRNEWSKDSPQQDHSKSSMYDGLRENVYKEVTQLISANENRPNFLIQLFRDLQHVRSDASRRDALQSIQSVIGDSGGNVGSPVFRRDSSLAAGPQRAATVASTPVRNKPEKMMKATSRGALNGVVDTVDPETQQVLLELLPFLKLHNKDIFHTSTLDLIKLMIFQLLPSKTTSSNNKLRNRLEHILSTSLRIYLGHRISDIKSDLLRTIANILLKELPVTSKNHQSPLIDNTSNQFMYLGMEASHLPQTGYREQKCQTNYIERKTGRSNLQASGAGAKMPHVDNGDLAEADQSRREADNEEGAVGGLLVAACKSPDPHANNCDVYFP